MKIYLKHCGFEPQNAPSFKEA